MSKRMIEALKIINDNQGMYGLTANQFAQIFWPYKKHSRLWDAVTNTGGYGACAGKKLWLCGGSYLGKLKKKGLIYERESFKWKLSEKGRQELLSANLA